MERFFSEQLGKIMLGLAAAWFITAAVLVRVTPAGVDDAPSIDYARSVQVVFKPEKIAPDENLFPEKRPEDCRGGERCVWVEPVQKPKEFASLPLPELTRAKVLAPPMLLPLPGPSLQGADKLPRWGEELPPVYIPPPPDTKKTVVNDPSAKGGAPVPPAPADPSKKGGGGSATEPGKKGAAPAPPDAGKKGTGPAPPAPVGPSKKGAGLAPAAPPSSRKKGAAQGEDEEPAP